MNVSFSFRRGDLIVEFKDGEFGVKLHRDVQRDAESIWLRMEELRWLIKVESRLTTARDALQDIDVAIE